MPTISFPASPALNDTYTFGSRTWKWNGTGWEIVPPVLNYVPLSSVGTANGVAGLDSGGKVPAAQLPSYVDDVLEYANLAGFPGTGETGKIYVAIDTGKTYRWSGSAYTEISQPPASTDEVPEGATNKYYSDAKVDARVAGKVIAVNLAYSSRATLRSGTPATGDLAIVENLGLFRFQVGSTEPDDDESCFATSNGRWLLEAVHWNVVSSWMDYPVVTAIKVEWSTSLTSVSANSTSTDTASVPGAAVGDAVAINLKSGSWDKDLVEVHAYVTAANVVTVRFVAGVGPGWPGDGTALGLENMVWTITVFKG